MRPRRKANGELAQQPFVALANAPPGIRLSSPIETIPFLASYRRAGLPAAASSDAQLGHAVYAYQSGGVASGMCGADEHVFWRIAGQHSRASGQSGGKTLTMQRAKVGLCPCCSSVTHVAIPGSSSIRAHSAYKDVVMQLWQASGPWCPRRSSAFQYVSASTLSINYPP